MRWCAALGLISIGLLSCGKDGEAPSSSNGEAAGSVLALEGKVSATREGSSPRPLTISAEVFADDMIVTQPGASITIRLSHNNVDWQLGESLTKQVQTSAAWRAPKSNSAPLLAGAPGADPNVAAGRHSEREAGEGASTAIANDPSPAPPAVVKRATAGLVRNDLPLKGVDDSRSKTGSAARASKPKPTKRPPSQSPVQTPKKPGKSGSIKGASSSGASGSRSAGASGSGGAGASSSGGEESVSLEAKKKESDKVLKDPTVKVGGTSGMSLIRKTIRLCYERSKASGKGQFMTSVKVDKNGKITSVKSGSTSDFDSTATPTTIKKMKSCVEKALLGKTAVGITERATSSVRFK